MESRSEALAERILQGAQELADFAKGCSDEDWQTICPNEERTVGVLVHHVGNSYVAELGAIKTLVEGKGLTGVTWDMVDAGNAKHASDNARVTKDDALAILEEKSRMMADFVRELGDDALDATGSISLNWNAPLTAQYFIEEHPVSHPFRHLSSIREALGR